MAKYTVTQTYKYTIFVEHNKAATMASGQLGLSERPTLQQNQRAVGLAVTTYSVFMYNYYPEGIPQADIPDATLTLILKMGGVWHTIGYYNVPKSRSSVGLPASSFIETIAEAGRKALATQAIEDIQFKASIPNAQDKYGTWNIALQINSTALRAYISFNTEWVYTNTKAPSSVSVSKTSIAPDDTFDVIWSGAAAGVANAIKGYDIYQSINGGAYTKVGTVNTNATSGRWTATIANRKPGDRFNYKIVTLGQVAYFDSPQSAASANVVVGFTDNGAVTNLKVDKSIALINSEINFTWSKPSTGTNNVITGYELFRNGAKVATIGASAVSYKTNAPGALGSTYTYVLKTIGKYGNVKNSNEVIFKTPSPVEAPKNLRIDNRVVLPGEAFTLSWDKVLDSTNNKVTGYQVFRADFSNGTYTLLDTVTTEQYSSVASESPGIKYFYKIKTLSEFYTSDFSASYISNESNVPPKAPTLVYPDVSEGLLTMLPLLRFNCPADVNDQLQHLVVDTNEAEEYTTGTFSGTQTITVGVNLVNGPNVITAYLVDELGVHGEPLVINVTKIVPGYARQISTGVVISNSTNSHAAEIEQLYSLVNLARKSCMLAPAQLPTTYNKWADWRLHMLSLQENLGGCFLASKKSLPIWETVPRYPTASVFNQIRTELEAY